MKKTPVVAGTKPRTREKRFLVRCLESKAEVFDFSAGFVLVEGHEADGGHLLVESFLLAGLVRVCGSLNQLLFGAFPKSQCTWKNHL